MVLANPQGGELINGNASISSHGINTVINQTSNKAIINWQSFNIGGSERVHFQQPIDGIALNRIDAQQGVSQIYGALTSTGQIILINPAGIYFGPSAYVNVGSLIATTANITDQNFLNGIYHFSYVAPYSGSIINQGTIIAANQGLIALIGNNVQNDGFIQAILGHIVLASGNAFTMNFDTTNLISFTVDEKSFSGSINNTGTLRADGGQILVSSNTASGVLDNIINMEGVAQARSVGMQQGEIILSANTDAGVIRVAGKLDVSGKNAGEKGGQVQITGHHILIDQPTVIDASGDLGGGEILIGGNYQGQGPLVNANATVVAANTDLIADAITSGKGGNVILWSNELTKFYGNISATGGMYSGDGGLVETSSKGYLEVMGAVNASSPLGTAGMWLLDPSNVTISSETSNGSFNNGDPNIFSTNANTATVNAATINASLNAGTSVTILTIPGGTQIGDITVTTSILKSGSLSTATLTLNAAGAITINNTITATSGGLNVTLIGDSLALNSAITTNGGNFLSTTQNATTLASSINTGQGKVAINVNQDAAQASNFSMHAGSSIKTTNTGDSAVVVNVNTAAGGTGSADLRSIATGSGGAVTIATNNGSITQTAGTLLNVGVGRINLFANPIGTSAVGTNAEKLLTQAASLNATAGSGGIFIHDNGTLNIVGLATPGTASVTASGLTQSGAIVADNLIAKTLNSVGGAITFSNTENEVNLVAFRARNTADTANDTGIVTFVNAKGFDVATIGTLSTINLTAAGAITDSGNITGTILTTSSSGGTILDFGHTLTSFNATNIGAGNIQLQNTRTFTLGNVSLIGGGNLIINNTGTLTITGVVNTGLGNVQLFSNLAVSDSTTGSIIASALAIKTLNNGGAPIMLDNINSHDLATIDLQVRNAADTANTSGTITYRGLNGFNISNLQTTGTAILTGSGVISQSGAMSGSTLVATTLNDLGSAIVFTNPGNSFNLVNLQTRNSTNSADVAAPISYANAKSLNITGLRTSGNATITVEGILSDTGNLIVGDTLTTRSMGGVTLNSAGNLITNFNVTNSGSGAITLIDTAPNLTLTGFNQNDFGGVSIINTGTLNIADGVTINSHNAAITLAVNDLILNTTAAINSGSADLSITQNTADGNIGLGNTAGTMTISGAELKRITANRLNLNTSNNGKIVVDGITTAQSGNIAGTTTLAATAGTLGAISFINNPSFFTELTANANDGILVFAGAGVTTTNNLVLNADVDGIVGGSDALMLNADLNAAGSMTLSALNGGIELGAPVNLTANGITINSKITGAQGLTIYSKSGPTTLGGIVSIASLSVDGNALVINTDAVTTSGEQTYNAPVVLGNDVTMTASNIVFRNGIAGARNLVLVGQPGDNNFSLIGPLTLNNITVTGSTLGNNNALAVNVGSFENWLLSGLNQGSISLTGVTGNFDFFQIQNLTGGSAGNTFAFKDGANINGWINGVNTVNAINSLDYSLYTTPITVLLANMLYSGDTQNNSAVFISHFININRLIGSESSILQLPENQTTLTFDSAASSILNGSLYLNRFDTFVTPNSTDLVVFVAHGIFDLATKLLTVDEAPVQLNGFNHNNFSGNIRFSGGLSTLPVSEAIAISKPSVANIITPFSTSPMDAKNNMLLNVLITNNPMSNDNLVRTDVLTAGAASSLVKVPSLNVAVSSKAYALAKQQNVIKLLSASSNFSTLILALFGAIFMVLFARQSSVKAFSFKVRTALNAIIGFSTLLEDEKFGRLTGKQKEYLNEILSESELISDELAKIEANNITVPDVYVSFNLSTSLKGINGLVALLRNGKTKITLKQSEYLDEICSGSNDILKLVST